MDAKADRKNKVLVVNRLSLERPDAAGDALARKAALGALLDAAADAIASYARFNGAESVSFGLVEAPGGAAFAKRCGQRWGKASSAICHIPFGLRHVRTRREGYNTTDRRYSA